MLGNFPKAFSQATASQGYFPKRQLPKSVLTTVLGPLAYPIRSARPHCSLQPLSTKPQAISSLRVLQITAEHTKSI